MLLKFSQFNVASNEEIKNLDPAATDLVIS
jgi:hypothetical protein